MSLTIQLRLNRQGNDIGTQYRSIILYSTEEQKQAIDRDHANLSKSFYQLQVMDPLSTSVKAIEKVLYQAEKYHQDYIAKNPNGYCPDHSTGVRFAKRKTLRHTLG